MVGPASEIAGQPEVEAQQPVEEEAQAAEAIEFVGSITENSHSSEVDTLLGSARRGRSVR